jgi:hypothetical protein
LCREQSTYQIAAAVGLDRQRVTRALRKAGVPVRARGAGRSRPVRRAGDPPDLPRRLRELYVDDGFGSPEITVILGRPERTVRDRLRRSGIPLRPAGGRTPFVRRWHASPAPLIEYSCLDDADLLVPSGCSL